MKKLIVALLLTLPLYGFAEENPKAATEGKEVKEAATEATATEAAATAAVIPVSMFMGTVTSMENYQPLSGCEIEIACPANDIKKTIQTDASGKFTFEQLPSGTYHVTIKRNGYETVSRTQQITEGSKLNLGFMLLGS